MSPTSKSEGPQMSASANHTQFGLETRQTDERVSRLIDAQRELTERLNTLTRDVAAMGVRIDQMAVVTSEIARSNAEQIRALSEQVKLLLDCIGRPQAGPVAAPDLPERPTVKDVARWLGKSPNMIYGLCRAEEIPCKRVGRSYIFDKASLLKWSEAEPLRGERRGSDRTR
jgi:hypothetical protein